MTTDQLKKWNIILTILVVLLIAWSIYAAIRTNGALTYLNELNVWLNKVAAFIGATDGSVGNPPPPPPKLF